MKWIYFLPGILFSVILFSCKKDGLSTGRGLYSSADTLKFDTVFTSAGSVTRSFKIINDRDQAVTLSSVKLMGGASSVYKMNVNGTVATEQNNVSIAANDSIYIFVSALIDPNSSTNPFLLTDSIAYSYNGSTNFVQLQAYGRNAVFLTNQTISSNTSWSNTLPYVIIGSLKVAQNVTLTVAAGTRVYARANAFIEVDGTLLVNGTRADPVIFRGDRLDAPYSNYPAGWDGIYFNQSSKDNRLVFAEIKNAYQALVADGPSVNSDPKLVIQQCIIDNAYNTGLFCNNSSVDVNNSLISNCSKNIFIQLGGNYNFTNCTVAAYATNYLFHTNPAVLLQNFANTNTGTVYGNLDAVFTNCIIWGSAGNINDELVLDKQGSSSFNVLVQNCIYRADAPSANATYTNALRNSDPLFDNIDIQNNAYDFHTAIDAAAPGINTGQTTSLLKDLDDNNRAVGIPDIGCYEKQ
ncbi:MAG: hypothetical protein WAT19_08650 [Ferruginibacter sp.]